MNVHSVRSIMPRTPSTDAPPSTRDRIVASARFLFATRGFGSTSIKAIARHAGVSQGSMYAHFDSKDDLLRSIFQDGLEDVWSTMPAPSADPLEDIETLMRRSFAIVGEHEDLWRLLYALRVQPEIVERLSLDLDAWGTAIEGQLRELCSNAGMANPRIEAKLLFAIIDGANQHRTLATDAYPIEELILATMAKFRDGRTS